MINKILLFLIIVFLLVVLGWCSPQCSNQETGKQKVAEIAPASETSEISDPAKVTSEKLEDTKSKTDVIPPPPPITAPPITAPPITAPPTAATPTAATPTTSKDSENLSAPPAPVNSSITQPVTESNEKAKPEAMGVATTNNSKKETVDIDPQFAEIGNGKTKIILEGVTFKFNSDQLTNQSIVTLEKLIQTLKLKNNLKIEIAGYTDDIGKPAYNIELSQRRSDAVVTYIKNNGIAASRLSAKGYGSQSPIADNATAKGRLKNRRVEVHIK